MDIEQLRMRANIIQSLRNFFVQKNFLELDTPALAENLIPETCLEIFKTQYMEPWSGKTHELYLVPSPEIHIKPIIAKHKTDVFQISKCYRNVESIGHLHKTEFTMLEYYKMNADYMDSLNITEELFFYLNKKFNLSEDLQPPFIRLSINDAFKQYCGFELFESAEKTSCIESFECTGSTFTNATEAKTKEISTEELAQKAIELGIMEINDHKFETWSWQELYELIFVHCVEPNLPKNKCVFLMNYPNKVSCLAQDADLFTKQRWELYGRGIELANCYSEETDGEKIKDYFEKEGRKKNLTARIKHDIDNDYWKYFSFEKGFSGFPKCSGTAMGVDRLIMLLCGKEDIKLV
ncbi:MAG: amino acid--tRNA ligase-related protein [Treponemataceae bacterium]